PFPRNPPHDRVDPGRLRLGSQQSLCCRVGAPPRRVEGAVLGVMCWLVVLLSVCAVALLSGCVSAPREAARTGDAVPLRGRAPGSRGHELFRQQRLSVHAGGKLQSLDVMLEVGAASVRLAVLGFGQTAALLEWDGVEMRESHADWWPPAV